MTLAEIDAIVDALLPAVDARITKAFANAPAPRDGRDGLPGVAGPAGPAGERGTDGRHGADGVNGINGRDGVDGVGFGDLFVEHDGERVLTVKAARGDVVKTIGVITLHGLPLYRGVWLDGRTYDPGDSVTWSGSEWHCHLTTTSKPGDGSKAWTLKVKRGRDGKDGR